MKLSRHSLTALFLGLSLQFLTPATLAQESRYVSDKLFVPLRSGMGSQFRITHRGLPSGTKLTLLEEDLDAGWSKVRTDKGKEGWVQNQYILNRPIAAQLLASANEKVAKMESRQAGLLAEIKTLKKEKAEITAAADSSAKESATLDSELRHIKEISAGALEMNVRHQELIQDHQLLQTERDALIAENEDLKKDRTYSQWLYGAAIIVAGMFLTLFFQSTGRRKRHSEWA